MKISARSALIAGVTTLTISAVAAAPSVQPLPPPRPEIHLAANVQPLVQPPVDSPAPHLLQILLSDPTRLLGSAVPIGTVTSPPAPIQFAIAPNLADTIDGIYIAVEPWVRWGFQVATDVLGWVPWVGWLSGQIMVFYNFGQSIVASGVFNFTDWLRGDLNAIHNLADFGLDVFWSFVYLGIDEWNYFLPPLPPLPFPIPPRPPLQGPFLAAADALLGQLAPGVGVTNAASNLVDAIYFPVEGAINDGVDVLQAALAPIPLVNIVGDQVSIVWNSLVQPIADSVVTDLIDPVLNQPLNINSYINGAVDVGTTTVDSLISTGANEINYVLGFPLIPTAAKAPAQKPNTTSEVSTVPSIVKNSLAADDPEAGALADVTKTVRNVRNEIRSSVNVRRDIAETSKPDGSGVVRAQGEVRGAVAEAVSDVADAARSGKPAKAADDVSKAPTTVAKSLGDTARKVVKEVRQAAKDARDAANDRSADDE